MTLISTSTASSSASLDITSSIDNTYKLYIFKFIDIHPATNSTMLMFNGSIDGGSNYNVTKTTTVFRAYHNEADSTAVLGYETGNDIAEGTGYQTILEGIGNENDESGAGTLWLFNPSNTTYVKHFYATLASYHGSNYETNQFTAGYFNTTDNIDAVSFKMSSDNMDAGTIKMYGVG